MLEEIADDESTSVTLLILMCGSSGSGQTTTIRDLSERLRSRVASRTHSSSGSSFDSMKHTGGRHGGQPIQTQLITQPPETPTKIRNEFFQRSHAILFVADTTAAGIEASTEELRIVEQAVASSPTPQPAIVIQANKRDADDAVDMDEVKSRFNPNDDRTVVETIATHGNGVRQAFVYAVRKGLENLSMTSKAGSREPEVTITTEPTHVTESDDLSPEKLPNGFTIKSTESQPPRSQKERVDDPGAAMAAPEKETISEPAQEPELVTAMAESTPPPAADSNVLTRVFRFFEGG